jgi:hypothetical protein
MGQGALKKKPALLASPKDFFGEGLDQALSHLKMTASPLSKTYLVDLLQYYMLAANLFPVNEETGRHERETLAETYLKSQTLPLSQKIEVLRKLGDTSLYISGFFGDSLNRKIVDIDYYAEMGGTAYATLARITSDEKLSTVYSDFSHRFLNFVDALTFMSQQSLVQSDEDLLRLYDRYVSTGSRIAEEQLLKKGVLFAELGRIKNNKQ